MLAQRDKHPSLILNNGEQHTTKLYELGCTPSTVVLHFTLNPNIEGSNPATGTGREKKFCKVDDGPAYVGTLRLFIPLEKKFCPLTIEDIDHKSFYYRSVTVS